MIDNDECFAFKKTGKLGVCKILKPADCLDCSFFKTKEEYKKGFNIVDEAKFSKGVMIDD